MDAAVENANRVFDYLVLQEQILSKGAFAIVGILSLVLFLIVIFRKKKRQWQCNYLLLLFATVLFSCVCGIMNAVYAADTGDLFRILFEIGTMFFPGLIFIHVWKNVSYKRLTSGRIAATFIIPLLVSAYLLFMLFLTNATVPMLESMSVTIVLRTAYAVYAIVMIVRSYLLCFNVFYQMPSHMRKATNKMLISITALMIYFASAFLWLAVLPDDIKAFGAARAIYPLTAPIAFGIMVFQLYDALYLGVAEDVIGTSREFVFANLSAMVLVLSRKEIILDWNRKDHGANLPFPDPLYREPFEHYRERILKGNNGSISKHNANVVSILHGYKDLQYLIRTHENKNDGRKFGYVKEIYDITPIYALVREFEELASYDRLTGLYNRNKYFEYAESLTQDQIPLVIIVGDVNNLKYINDTLGHRIGDALLSCISRIMAKHMPKGTFAARTGGDEFALLIPGSSLKAAQSFIDTVNGEYSQINDERFGTPSISWGYGIMESIDQDYNALYDIADKMMYATKSKHQKFRSPGLLPDKP